MSNVILEGKKLQKSFSDKGGNIDAVNSVDFTLRTGQFLGIVGESGSGKSTLLRLIAGLEKADEGSLFYKEKEYTNASPAENGRFLQMIFQDAYASFDPRMKMKDSILEGEKNTCPEAKLYDTMDKLGLEKGLLEKRPKELSGGQCQRMSILRALLCGAEILLCDEITSALDVVTQAQICELLLQLRNQREFSLIFVSHDISLVSNLCDEMLVMYEGSVVEEGKTKDVITSPNHPYTKSLISCSKGLSLS